MVKLDVDEAVGHGVIGLEREIRAALPQLSFGARVVLDALLISGGPIGSQASIARHLGLPSRFAFSRMMRREGLPALRELAAWMSVLKWLTAAERSGESLFAVATHSRRSPAM